jgi:hypothetical protein
VLEGLITYAKDQTALGMLRALVDIFLVYYVVYRVLLVARGTRALQVAIGLGAVFLLYVVAQVMPSRTTFGAGSSASVRAAGAGSGSGRPLKNPR